MKRYTLLAALVLMLGAGPATMPRVPTTKPTTQPAEYPALRAQLLSLTSEVQRLTKENLTLKKSLDESRQMLDALIAKSTSAKANALPKSTFTQRATEYAKYAESKTFAEDGLKRAKKVDANIDAYLATHDVNPMTIAALYEGRIIVGMTEDELSLIMCGERGDPVETQNSVTFTCLVHDFGPGSEWPLYRVRITNGAVSMVAKQG